MKHLYITFLILAATMVAACSDDSPAVAGNEEGTPTKIVIDAGIIETGAKSRAPEVKLFASGAQFGMFVYDYGTTHPFSSNTANIRVAYNRKVGSNYFPRFYYNKGAYSSEDLFLVNNPKYPKNADFFAYYPYGNAVTDLSNIIYSTNTDIMVAEENFDSDINKNIDVSSGGVQVITLHFVRRMAKFNFGFRFAGGKYAGDGDKQLLKSITIKQVNPQIVIYDKLKLNALTGEVSPTNSANLVISPSFNINSFVGDTDAEGNDVYSVYSTYNLPYDLSGLADDDTVFDVVFTLSDYSVEVYTLHVTKAMLRHSDGTYGIREGFVYNFNMTMENYLHVDQVFVDKDWVTVEEEYTIQI